MSSPQKNNGDGIAGTIFPNCPPGFDPDVCKSLYSLCSADMTTRFDSEKKEKGTHVTFCGCLRSMVDQTKPNRGHKCTPFIAAVQRSSRCNDIVGGGNMNAYIQACKLGNTFPKFPKENPLMQACTGCAGECGGDVPSAFCAQGPGRPTYKGCPKYDSASLVFDVTDDMLAPLSCGTTNSTFEKDVQCCVLDKSKPATPSDYFKEWAGKGSFPNEPWVTENQPDCSNALPLSACKGTDVDVYAKMPTVTFYTNPHGAIDPNNYRYVKLPSKFGQDNLLTSSRLTYECECEQKHVLVPGSWTPKN